MSQPVNYVGGASGRSGPCAAPLATRRDILGAQGRDAVDDLASSIARTARVSAYMAMGQTQAWCERLLVQLGDGNAKEIVGQPMRNEELHKLVQIDFERDGNPVFPERIVTLAARELEPFIIGVGKITTRQTAEGLVVLLAGDWAT